MIGWFLINALAFVGTPAGMLDGWIVYARLAERSSLRSKLGLAALILAAFSVLSLAMYSSTHMTPTTPMSRWVSRFGIYAAIAGAAISFSTKPRLIAPTLFANAGSFMLWFGLTQP